MNHFIRNPKEEFPKEEFIELRGLSPELVGRITVHQNQGRFDAEVDIVLAESGKIFKHVGMLYKEEDGREALTMGIHRLKRYLSSLTE